ncbi:efflux RND transporter permease subunit [Simiduia agarivorans]|uniref:AcrB/AcrD/AcrF family protein n=1 Tax=Simiduia agarivorans (strain DSM 21679 / JCM 13881 / BCRC 17597 / SA1) TaxID=1117647 RepID=K4KQ76_SIMAS|nr:efflux RND transporter permease subunit [Simiduia agarivorans]AFV00269.1 AcrB/AcrD/AcrF family protein [Simiduia agarivorans SA1 = DSM 21679]
MSHWLDRTVGSTLKGGLPLFIFIASLLTGVLALQFTAREEEPQIVVPMVDVLVQAPGLSARQTERQVTTPLEKLLAQIPGVEHVYSVSQTGQAAVTLRFYVGQDREEAILNTYNKLYSNQDRIPGVVSDWLVRPVEVDDVPIMVLSLWSSDPGRYTDFELRRFAEDISTGLQAIPQTSEVKVVGGRPRTITLKVKPEALSARKITPAEIVSALGLSNQLQSAGLWTFNNEAIQLESGDFIRTRAELEQLVVSVIDGVPVYLQDLVTINDGPEEARHYTWIDFAPGHPEFRSANDGYPMVAISVAKQRGSNAVTVADAVHQLIATLEQELLPPEIQVEVIRDYGQTANEKVNNLTSSLGFAIITVVIFIGVFLGWRQALVVGLAVPICYGATLGLDMAFGYTINRVTLFALILSLGLLVDDPITGVDNISRFLKEGSGSKAERIVGAISELKVPLVMSTLTIVLAFVPLAFITGMMGPYMAPMAFNVPVSVIASTLVAFLVTPWLASKFLKADDYVAEPSANNESAYARMITPLLDNPRRAKGVLWIMLALFIGAALLPMFRTVPLKLLPFDNKNEVQIVVDMPESASLEQTAAMARRISAQVSQVPEVRAVAAFVGTPSPMDFNGMVRRYYQRTGNHMADLRLTLVDKTEREHQSHGVVLRLRALLAPFNTGDINIKVVEVPPGPPVLSTLVAEIYGEGLTDYATQRDAARVLMDRLAREAHVTEIDSTVEAHQSRQRFVLDKQKAALSGVATEDVNATLAMANGGYNAGFLQGYLHAERESAPLPVQLRLPVDERASLNDFLSLQVKGRPGIAQQSNPQGLETAPQPLVSLGELGGFVALDADRAIHHKDLQPVVYVMAELNGRTPAEIIADVNADQGAEPGAAQTEWQSRNFITSFFAGPGDGWQLPAGTTLKWTGEGEWRITKDVFRDMGLAFAFALAAIFVVLRMQTASTALSLIIMSAIPLTIIGIMPGFWFLNQWGERVIAGSPEPVLFTATAMIGMIALAGIVVRNSLILVEFITQARAAGNSIRDALIAAGSVRMRPVLLTAGTTLLGNLVITLDPVFSGLALAIIFGIIASTLFTLIVVPVVYLLVFGNSEHAHD